MACCESGAISCLRRPPMAGVAEDLQARQAAVQLDGIDHIDGCGRDSLSIDVKPR